LLIWTVGVWGGEFGEAKRGGRGGSSGVWTDGVGKWEFGRLLSHFLYRWLRHFYIGGLATFYRSCGRVRVAVGGRLGCTCVYGGGVWTDMSGELVWLL